MKKLTKSNDRIIAGVCGGIAEYFGFDATIVRLVTAALALFTAIVPSVILYLIAAMIIPDASPKKTWGSSFNWYIILYPNSSLVRLHCRN